MPDKKKVKLPPPQDKMPAARDELLLAADAHLDVEPWTGRPIHGDSFHAFEHLVGQAIRLQVRWLIVAGDLIDVRRPPSRVIDFLRQQIDRLDDQGIRFGSVDGQHELASPPWICAVHSKARALHRCSVPIAGKRLYGMNWTPADQLAEELARIPEDTYFLVCHQVWSEFMGELTAPEGSLVDVPHARVIFTGDYHEQNMLSLGNGRIAYSPGATHMRNIAEPGHHYYYVVNERGEVRRERIPGRAIFRASIRSEASVRKLQQLWQEKEAARQTLPEELQKPLMRITYPADKPELKKVVRDLFAEKAHLFWKKEVPEAQAAVQSGLSAEQVRQLGPAGCLKLVVPETDKRYKPLLRLLQAADRKEELLAMRKERLG